MSYTLLPSFLGRSPRFPQRNYLELFVLPMVWGADKLLILLFIIYIIYIYMLPYILYLKGLFIYTQLSTVKALGSGEIGEQYLKQ